MSKKDGFNNGLFSSSEGVTDDFLQQLSDKAVDKPWWDKHPKDATLEECQRFAYNDLLLSKDDVRKHGSLAKKETFVRCFIALRNAPYDLLENPESGNASPSADKSTSVCLGNQISDAVVKRPKPKTVAENGEKPAPTPMSGDGSHAKFTRALQKRFPQPSEAGQDDSEELPEKDKHGRYILDSSTSRKILASLCHEMGIKPIEGSDKSSKACWRNALGNAGLVSGIGKPPVEANKPIPVKGPDGMYAATDVEGAERYVVIRLCLDEGIAPHDWEDVPHHCTWWANRLARHGLVSSVEVPFEKRLGAYKKKSEEELPNPPYSMEHLRAASLCELMALVHKNGISAYGKHPICLVEAFRLAGLTDDRWILRVNRNEPIKTARFLASVAKIVGVSAPKGADVDDLEVWVSLLATAEHPAVLDFVQDRQNKSSEFKRVSVHAPQIGCK